LGWSWSFPGATPSSSTLRDPQGIAYTTAGNFDVILITTNAVGQDTATFTNYITVGEVPSINTVTTVDISCFGSNDGSINIDFSGGTSPFTFTWSNGDSVQNLSGLGQDTLSLSIIDSFGCGTAVTDTIWEPTALSLQMGSSNINCYGDDDGGGSAIDQGLGRRNRPNRLSESRGEAYTITFNNTLNYVKTFGNKHDFSTLIGTEYITNYESSIGASRARFPFTDDEFRFLDFGGTDLDVWNSGSASEWALFSYFGSASYMFDNKYMVTANLRADASSKFAENNRWGYFPSISAGWKISDESFLNDVDWLSNLKLRASWGQVGNQEIDNYTFLTLISQVDGIITTNRFGNPDLKWETSTQTNIGLDVGLFNNKLAVSMEYFDKNTTDILLPISLPSVVGNVQPTILNAGEVSNKGFEFSLNYRNSENEFKYNINANFATLSNNVEKLHPNLPNISGDVTRTEVGQPLDAYYGYRMIGIYQNQAEIDSHLSGTVNATAKPGDIKFKDINGDGIISSDDREFIGSPIPDLTYGLSFSSTYKGFDFSLLFQGVEGVDRYNDGKQIVDFDTRPFNYSTAILGAWDGEGSTNTRPRVAFEDNGSSRKSSIFVEDASYFRLKNIEVGYTIESIKGIQDIRFYISGQNLFTSTDYTGLDPETVDLKDKGTYPSSTSVLFGVNFNF